MTKTTLLLIPLALGLAGAALAGNDSDGDGVMDSVDNCKMHANSATTPGHQMSQQDTDQDGFGNRCDADFNNNGVVNAQDAGLFNQCLMASGKAATQPAGLTTSTGTACESMDLNDDGLVNSRDTALFNQLKQSPTPGPSGLACAATAAGSDNLTGASPCVAAP
jgi:hypothetical protein